MKSVRRQRGVALLMVLAGLALMSGLVVEFAYNSNVTYNLAMNELDRVQAYYLAQSGINFSKLILKFDKEAQKVAKEASKKMGRDIQIQPLYEMIPINTTLFRSLSGLSEASEEGGTDSGGETDGEGGEEPSSLEQGMNLIDSKGMKDFLNFRGDFSAEVEMEDSKLNLNIFYNLSPKQKSYDRIKSTLYHILASEAFSGLFEDRYRGAQELAQNIVDFIDKDEVHNDPGGEERGREVVRGDAKSVMKNAKLLSLEELLLIPGMTDAVFQKLKEFVTIYGSDEKIYICRSKDPLARALIIAYSENNPRMEPIKDDNEELLTKVTDAVFGMCPATGSMEQAINEVLGLGPEDADEPSSTTSTATKEGSTTQQNTGQNSASQGFQELVKEDGNIYTIVGTGIVGESEVKLKTVVDTSSGNSRQWKEIYWRVE